jgi:hypothetical protein
MADFIADGIQNPRLVRNQKNFTVLFTSWIVADDQPWTTGETEEIQELLDFIGCIYKLPSDTTVRRYVARIFGATRDTLITEMAVSLLLQVFTLN